MEIEKVKIPKRSLKRRLKKWWKKKKKKILGVLAIIFLVGLGATLFILQSTSEKPDALYMGEPE